MKIGFLPLYVKLYDDVVPHHRERHTKFYSELTELLRAKGNQVITSEFCRLKEEFAKTVKDFEKQNVDVIITHHLAYSPSLEAVDALSSTELPIVVLDTTSTLEFTNMQSPGEISYCHGIHGVMDMCSMLMRRGKKYAIAAGHYLDGVIDRALGLAKAAVAAKALGKSKVARIGGPFAGMGDFVVPFELLKERFGIEAYDLDRETVLKYTDSVTSEEVELERIENEKSFDFAGDINKEEYDSTLRSTVAMRKCIEGEALTAFTATFLGMGKEQCGLEVMPFLECCKAMSRGIGYAGEGDVLTAAFTGAILQGYGETTFCEIFCPDWKNDMLFLSHMGEVNYAVADVRPTIKRVGTNYAPTAFPYVGYTRMKGGKGVFVNVCHTGKDFRLVLSECEMVDYDSDNFGGSMRGWMKTGKKSCSEFLEDLSKAGATHHSIFVYGANAKEIKYFAELLDIETVEI